MELMIASVCQHLDEFRSAIIKNYTFQFGTLFLGHSFYFVVMRFGGKTGDEVNQ